jgi:hypothetical protein
MLSAVYQQSSDPRPLAGAPDPRQVDPSNRLLSHFHRQRVDFEEMRDALLAASGELDLTMGGKPADLFADGMKRRSIYGLVDRQFVPATFRAFDFASPDTHVDQRHETTVPQQGLFFLNHKFVASRAKALLKRRPLRKPRHRRSACKALYQACFQRAPKASETAAALSFLASTKEKSRKHPEDSAAAWQYGWGKYDPAKGRVKSFTPLPHFTGTAWQGGPSWPDAALGWAQLTRRVDTRATISSTP